MAMSLQDQLLKAGLTNEKKAKKAKKSNKKNRDLKREIKAATEEKRQTQLEKDKQLNQEIKQQADQKAILAQIKQLIETHKLAETGEFKFNFTDDSKVKFVNVTDSQQKQLSNGHLAIVKADSDYAMVPTKVAEKIALREESLVVSLSQPEEVDEDDPYKDFVIPDDLMW